MLHAEAQLRDVSSGCGSLSRVQSRDLSTRFFPLLNGLLHLSDLGNSRISGALSLWQLVMLTITPHIENSRCVPAGANYSTCLAAMTI
jgi:hypothetical protein